MEGKGKGISACGKISGDTNYKISTCSDPLERKDKAPV